MRTETDCCEPRVLGLYDVDEVIASYVNLYSAGRHRAPPPRDLFHWMTTRGHAWVLAELPLAILNYQTLEESGDSRIELAKTYAKKMGGFPPGSASYNERSQRRRAGKAYVADGNHRTLAAQIRGDCAIRMFMPRGEYEALISDAEFRGLLD